MLMRGKSRLRTKRKRCRPFRERRSVGSEPALSAWTSWLTPPRAGWKLAFLESEIIEMPVYLEHSVRRVELDALSSPNLLHWISSLDGSSVRRRNLQRKKTVWSCSARVFRFRRLTNSVVVGPVEPVGERRARQVYRRQGEPPGVRLICEIQAFSQARCSQKSSERLLSTAHRRSRIR